MEKELNVAAVESAMMAKGLNQAKLAGSLNVTPTSVSQWLQGRKMPRPDKLLRLGLLLQLPFSEIVHEKPDPMAPVVAFRKRSMCKRNDGQAAAARRRGQLLKQLVPYLPFDRLVAPKTLKQPRHDYAYLQEVVRRVRDMMGVRPDEKLAIRHLIRLFSDLHTVLIPVMWGTKGHYADGLHIYLPDSKTRWVYVNLDSYVWDFAFWMAHELGHSLAPDLSEGQDEAFANAFAQALLFPECVASVAADELAGLASLQQRIARVLELGKERMISPLTVVYATEQYAKVTGRPAPIDSKNQSVHAAVKAEQRAVPTVSQVCFQERETPIPPSRFVRAVKETFGSPFFEALRAFLLAHPQEASFVQELLDIPLLDAKAIYEELR